MLTLLIVIFSIVLGTTFGFFQKNNKRLHTFFSLLTIVLVYALLFTLGIDLGRKEEIYEQLPVLGIISFFIALFGSAGSISLVVCIQRFYGEGKTCVTESSIRPGNSFIATLKILFWFVLGMFLSHFSYLPVWIYGEKYTEYLLWCMVFSIGVGLGLDIKSFIIVRQKFYVLFAIPLLIVLGTILGTAFVGMIFPQFSVKDTITAGCGLGYYTLSSLLVGETGNTSLATVTLLSNIFREMLGVMSTPFLARYIGPLSSVAVGAATSMDTSLPVITMCCGERVAIISVFSGMVLTIIVPFLVSFCLYL